MATVNQCYDFLNDWAPVQTQMSFDNAGFLVGRGDRQVTTILVALDITENVVEEAKRIGAQLIIAHHPVIFSPVKSITDSGITGRILLSLAENKIAAICAHTNLDAAQGGVNDCLATALGLTAVEFLHTDGVDAQGRAYGIGRIGVPHAQNLTSDVYAAFVRDTLNAKGVRVCKGKKPVSKVAVGGGSCGSMLGDVVAAGCDTFVTGDVKYDVFLEAQALGITLIDAGHYPTEQVVCPEIVARLQAEFPALAVHLSAAHREVSHAV